MIINLWPLGQKTSKNMIKKKKKTNPPELSSGYNNFWGLNSYYFLTASLRAFPALNTGTLRAGMLIGLPF